MEEKKKNKIAVDIDDVLANFQIHFLEFYNKRNGTNFKLKDMFSYDYEKVFKTSKEESREQLNAFYNSQDFSKITPIEGAKESIFELGKKNNLYVITSRPDSTSKETVRWLNEHFPNIFLKVHFINQHQENIPKKSKSEICLKNGYSIIIEDAPKYANECAEKNINVFLLTRPWNLKEKMNPNIKRVKNWQEVLKNLS